MKSPQQAKRQHHRHGDDHLPTHDNAHRLVSYPRHNVVSVRKQRLGVTLGGGKLSRKNPILIPQPAPLSRLFV